MQAKLNDRLDEEVLSQERTFIAHELHDSLAQTLASVRFTIRNLDHAIQGGDECEIFEIMETLENNVELANRELRELITRFRAPFDELSLIPAIKAQVEKFESETGIRTVFQNKTKGLSASTLVASQVIRIVQEALANVRKHAGASVVRVAIRPDGESVKVLVEDDGCGFECESGQNDSEESFGLKVMNERAARIDGILKIESAESEGTRVLLTLSGM